MNIKGPEAELRGSGLL